MGAVIDHRFTGPRLEEYGVNIIRPNGLVEPLDGITDGKVEMNVDRTIMGGGSLTLIERGQTIDWMKDRIQPWVKVNGLSWPLGLYLPASPKAHWRTEGKVWEVPMLDRLSVLDEYKTDQTYSLAPGALVTGAVRNLIEQTGETGVSLTDNFLLTRDLLVWEPGTSILRICNDLLAHVNYQRLWCDGQGQYRIEPYVHPEDRPVAAEFVEGETAIHSPKVTRDQDILGVPNKVVLTSSSTDDQPALVSVATNEIPDNPYSYQARGRWVVRTYENVEAADQATLDARASQYLWTASNPVANISVQHAVVPLEPFQRVRLVNGDLDATAWVNEWGITLRPGSLMTGLWTELTRE